MCMESMQEFVTQANNSFEQMTETYGQTHARLEKLNSIEAALAMIANNTKSIHETMTGFREDNRELLGIATGKKQVPMAIFIAVVSVLSVLLVLEKIDDTSGELSLSPTSFHFIPRLGNGNKTTQTDTIR